LSLRVRPTNFVARSFRLTRLALHLVRAVAIVAVCFPFYNHATRMEWLRRWAAHLLEILAVRLKVIGKPPIDSAAPTMIVANHVSWLDIFAINALRKARFVAKSEIRHWPVFGWLCAQGSGLFIERARRHHAAHIHRQMVAALKQGDLLVLFPEGSTSTGDKVLPFHTSLLQPALECNAMLYPVAIRYARTGGSLCSEADYAGGKTMLGSLLLMLTQPVIFAQLQFLPPLTSAGQHRRELAYEASRLIAGALGVPAPRRQAGTTAPSG
jgi:1-acyl-sn-glycerol-3-phosphate acyltransferase